MRTSFNEPFEQQLILFLKEISPPDKCLFLGLVFLFPTRIEVLGGRESHVLFASLILSFSLNKKFLIDVLGN